MKSEQNKLPKIAQSIFLLIYLALIEYYYFIPLVSLSFILKILEIKYKKYEIWILCLSYILETIPLGFIIQNQSTSTIIITHQLIYHYNFRIQYPGLCYLLIMLQVSHYDLLPLILAILLIICFIFQQEYIKQSQFQYPSPIESSTTHMNKQRQHTLDIDSSLKVNIQKTNHEYHYQYFSLGVKTNQNIDRQIDLYQQVIEEFPEGVAFLSIKQQQQLEVEFSNQTILSMLRAQRPTLIDALSKLQNLKIQKTGYDDNAEFEFKSFGQAKLDIPLIQNKKIFKTPTASQFMDEIQYFNKTRRRTQKGNPFSISIESAILKIRNKETQNLLQKAQISFDLHSILTGQLIQGEHKRFLEIKIFLSYLNCSPSLLIIVRDVTHREYIKDIYQQNKAKSNTLNYVYHEMRTPLNCIIQLLENWTIKNDDIETVLSICYYLLNFSNDLMDLAQVKVGKFKLTKIVFNLEALILQCLQQFRVQSSRRNIQMILNYGSDVPKEIYNDDIRIKQVLINLIGNAFKYTIKGSITIEVILTEDNFIKIKIIDTGLGIREEDKNKLLTAFGRIDNDESKVLNRQGVGLGLMISNIICQQLNLQEKGIQIKSEINVGSVFAFDIDYCQTMQRISIENLIKEADNDDESSNKNQQQNDNIKNNIKSGDNEEIQIINVTDGQKSFDQQKSKNEEFGSLDISVRAQQVYAQINIKFKDVLIIDDDQFVSESVKQILKNLGINQVDCAINCHHAIEILKSKIENNTYYRLILLDLEMPIIDGFNTFKEITQLYNDTKNLPYFPSIIACSGYSKGTAAQQSLKLGMDDYYEKPLRKTDLQEIISKYIRSL